MSPLDPIALSQALIRQASLSDQDDPGAIAVLEEVLVPLGFTCHRITCEGVVAGVPVENLYARWGKGVPNLCFGGHTDVVPAGDLAGWSVDPFAGVIVASGARENPSSVIHHPSSILIGRGAVDMKAAIACWVVAAAEYLEAHKDFKGSLSFLITADEETGSHGMPATLEWLKKHGEKIDACIVGEPTNPSKLGEMAKIGRRGSLNFTLAVEGKQGHVAYPKLADNPVTTLVEILHRIKNTPLDSGNAHFQPSNLEVVNIEVGNKATNVISARAKAVFNVRFNDSYSRKKLTEWVRAQCDAVTKNYTLETDRGSESFLTQPGRLSDIVVAAVKEITRKTPELSTTGGTSDARFIKDICPVVEFGLINETAHKVDEQVAVEDILGLTKIYGEIIARYFGG